MDTAMAQAQAPKNRRKPLGVKIFQGVIPWDKNHTKVFERGALISVDELDAQLNFGGRTETELHIGRLSSFLGFLTGRLVLTVETNLRQPSKNIRHLGDSNA